MGVGICCCTKSLVVTLAGCSGHPLDGEDVTLSQSGVTIATQTTDGAGQTTFTGLSAGTYTLASHPARFNSSTASATVLGGAPTTSVTFSPAIDSTLYVCLNVCARPLKKTLVWTCATTGNMTMTYVGAGTPGWYVNVTDPGTILGFQAYSYPGCCSVAACSAHTTCGPVLGGPQAFWFLRASDGKLVYDYNGPGAAAGSVSAGTAREVVLTASSIVCPPSFLWSFTTSCSYSIFCDDPAITE